ncbi:MAG: TnpV protein [Clostridiales bacterium]|nr:TnpV protein [Clostridiales bacterium]
MEQFIHDETNGLDYELVGNYYLPCLQAPEPPKVGRFEMIYLDYLRNNKRPICSGLFMSGKLKNHVEEIDKQAEEMFSQLVEQMAKDEGVDETLKRRNQLSWVQQMNSIRNRAEEIVLREVVFTQENHLTTSCRPYIQ